MTGAQGLGHEFRPEIQALRAVAVLLVLLFHLAPERLPGGYVGVDVFFVISGFLISGHLAREATSTGRISLPRFWARRIKRLLPAAAVVLVASLVSTLLFVPRPLWQATAIEIGASALNIQNWVLGANAVDYLAGTQQPTSVQHYWSLSVEEQFYLVWPILILLALALARSHRRRAIVVALAVVATASLAYSIVGTALDPSYAYFNTAARAWEFALGGLLALGPVSWFATRSQRVRSSVGAVLGWLGVALIGAAALLFDRDTPFPGTAALIPVMGTALVIVAGRSGGSPWSPAFVAPFGPLQLLGRISYSVYLWHWPLIVILPYVVGHSLGWKWNLAIVAMTLALAWLTTRFVEDPVRFGPLGQGRPRRAFAFAAGVIAVIVAGSTITWVNVEQGISATSARVASALATEPCFGAPALGDPSCDAPFRVPADVDTAFAAQDDWRMQGVCTFPRPDVGLQLCEYGDVTDPETTVLFVGNSHATHLTPAATRYGEDLGWRIQLMTRRNCLGVTTEPVGVAPDPACIEWSRAVIDSIVERTDIDLVVFASYRSVLDYIAPDDPTSSQLDDLREQIVDTFERILASGASVAVIDDSPSAPFDVPECVDLNREQYDPCTFSDPTSPENLVTEAADLLGQVTRIDPRPWYCDALRCHSVVGGVVVLFDNNHLTGTYSRSLAPLLGVELERALDAGLAP